MKPFAALGCAVLLAATPAVRAETSPDQAALLRTVAGLDAGLFGSFNHCASPDQLRMHASYFARDVEFYHDKAGVTWTRHDYMANTRDHVCGQFRRELIPGSLEVYPVKDFGAIEQGEQRFCWLTSGKCFGRARFLILWRHQGQRWLITRVFSYGHDRTP